MFCVDFVMVSCLLDYSFYQIRWINTYLEGEVDLYYKLYITLVKTLIFSWFLFIIEIF